MIRHYCDGCGQRLEGESLAAAQLFGQQAAKQITYAQELFCGECREHAEEYWKDKAPVFEKGFQVFSATIENHRSDFFKNRRKKLRKVSG